MYIIGTNMQPAIRYYVYLIQVLHTHFVSGTILFGSVHSMYTVRSLSSEVLICARAIGCDFELYCYCARPVRESILLSPTFVLAYCQERLKHGNALRLVKPRPWLDSSSVSVTECYWGSPCKCLL